MEDDLFALLKYGFFLFLSLFLSSLLLILPEGVVVGIQIFAWAPN